MHFALVLLPFRGCRVAHELVRKLSDALKAFRREQSPVVRHHVRIRKREGKSLSDYGAQFLRGELETVCRLDADCSTGAPFAHGFGAALATGTMLQCACTWSLGMAR